MPRVKDVLGFLASAAVVCAGLVWVYLFIRPWIQQRSATGELAELARARGLAFRARDRQLASRLAHPPFDRAGSRWYRNVLSGSHRGRTLSLFTFHALDTSTDDEAFFTVLGLSPVGQVLPATRVLPVEGRQLLLDWKRRRRPPRGEPVIECPAADPGYRVVSSAPAFADRLQRQVVDLLRPWPGLAFAVDGDAVLLIDQRNDVRHWLANLEAALPLLDTLVDTVLREVAAGPAAG